MSINSTMMPNALLSKGSTLMPYALLNNAKEVIIDHYAVLSGVPAVMIKRKRPEFIKLVEETENE